MNLRKFVFGFVPAAVLASSLVFWACGDSDGSLAAGEDLSSSSSVVQSSSAKVSSSSEVVVSS